jgi:hypothetical protein
MNSFLRRQMIRPYQKATRCDQSQQPRHALYLLQHRRYRSLACGGPPSLWASAALDWSGIGHIDLLWGKKLDDE